jgi:serine/threonine-protein kinase
MSPEQACGDLDSLGPRSDVYSLGATLYCLLTGRPPVEADDVGAVLRAVQKGDFLPPRRLDPQIDPALEAVCLRAMALRAEDRYPTPRALAEDIEHWMADEPVAAWREPWTRRARRWERRHRAAVMAATSAVLVALAGMFSVLVVQARANSELTRSNNALAAANERERARFALAMDAVKLFHGEVSEDLLLKEKPFEALRWRPIRGPTPEHGWRLRRASSRSAGSSMGPGICPGPLRRMTRHAS